MRRLALLSVLILTTTALADPESDLVAALSSDKVFLRGEGKIARAAFAKFFEQKNADDIKTAFEKDTAIVAFLDSNPDIKEQLYTAIDPEFDKVVPALQLFRELYKHAPERVKAYPNVAIAIAVTWDDPAAIYDYTGHQRRTRSILPEEVSKVDAIANFDYLTTRTEGPMKNAIQFFPWEFLVHVVNHKTPDEERTWAVKNYLPRRAGIGTSYKEVQYDNEMLRTEIANGVGKADCKLTGQPYTLPSIKKYGGVCAMQADYAARLAKSLAVPAEYVGGESNSGGRHAWVMWVEVRSATKEKIDYALVSEGRYLGDQYYVGELKNPKTGQPMTDRDMERRLWFVGTSPQNARQADLLMRAFPVIRDEQKLTTAQQLTFLRRVLELFPSAERAWLALAELYRDGKLKDPAEAVPLVDRAITTFANYPDFSWKLADDLLTPVKDKITRARKFEVLVARYETLGRPDLACEARLKLVEYQTDAKDYKKAADGLAQTVRKFPDEGRYVPKMMEKLQEVCATKEFKGGIDLLAKFYLEVLPRIPKTRGTEISKYCVKMHEQAVEFLKSNNKTREAALVEDQLNRLRAGKV